MRVDVDLTDREVHDLRRSMERAFREAAREATRIRDPAELAAFAFDLCRPLWRLPERLAEELVTLVSEDPHGRPLLWAIATSASPPASQLAAVQIALRDEPLPTGTAMQVGMLEVDRVFAFEGDSRSTLVLGGSRPDVEGIQIFGLTIERETTGGAVLDGVACYTSEPAKLEELRDATAADLGIEPTEIAPAEALDRVLAATRRCGELGLRPSNQGMLAVNLLVRAGRAADAEDVLARLPDGIPPSEDEDELAEALEAWCDDGDLGEDWPALVMVVGTALFEFQVDLAGEALADLDRTMVEEFLLDHMAESDDLLDRDAERVPAAVAEVLRFLAETDRLDPAEAQDLAEAATALTRRFVAVRSRRRTSEGPAAALILAMTADGVDLHDRAAVAAWIADYNSLTIAERKARVPMRSLGDDVVAVPSRGGKRGRAVKARKTQRQARRRNRRR